MSTSSIRPAKLADAIADHIQQMILEGLLQPGERLLSERELSAKLDVSRPSLREALDKLIDQGLLTTNAQGVAHVSENVGRSLRDPLVQLMDTPEARFDVLELRSIMEAAAAGFAAERASEVDREVITERFKAMVAAHDEGDVDSIAKTDAEFHLAIYEASHNLMMLHFMRSLEGFLRSNVYLNRKNLFEHRPMKESQLSEHRAIFEAIMDRDPERARDAARTHMTTAMQTQREIYEAERRLEASIRRLSRSDLVAERKVRAAG
ncbi:FCD domain-containing protein [Phenylobacterium sp. J367]|uniref:FCD domain-containing protein n=1 Tax=Phenylobacterium sp. J367 TaxID=2898435 RepID=UPI0021518EEB|nr:FCD domain-containing protein [Phenylobacterium sp. J367]MCR5877211.1 FCD domain-containing protein [Phenylobacterium sp. J367]